MHPKAEILIVHRHPMVRLGVRCSLGKHDITVTAEAATTAEALNAFEAACPDLVLCDVSRAEDRTAAELVRRLSVLRRNVPVVVFADDGTSEGTLRQMVQDGVRGFVATTRSHETLPRAVRRVLSGQVHVDDELLHLLVGFLADGDPKGPSSAADLTERELEVLQLCGQGFRPSTIAERLHVSPKTVHSHRENLKRKLQMPSAAQLDRFAIQWLRGEATL